MYQHVYVLQSTPPCSQTAPTPFAFFCHLTSLQRRLSLNCRLVCVTIVAGLYGIIQWPTVSVCNLSQFRHLPLPQAYYHTSARGYHCLLPQEISLLYVYSLANLGRLRSLALSPPTPADSLSSQRIFVPTVGLAFPLGQYSLYPPHTARTDRNQHGIDKDYQILGRSPHGSSAQMEIQAGLSVA